MPRNSLGLRDKAEQLLLVLNNNPFQTPPPYEKLVGDLSGAYSRLINIQHRLVYQVLEEEHTVKVLRLWTHYAQPSSQSQRQATSIFSLQFNNDSEAGR